jgi:iron(III) transport system substrate-binding protein
MFNLCRSSRLKDVLVGSIVAASIAAACLSGCSRQPSDEVVIYCGVDEPVASPVLDDFEKQSGIHVAVRYDIESSKSIGLAGRLEAEKDYPQADVWWGSEAFLSERLAEQDVLAKYRSPAAADIPGSFKDVEGYWTGTALRARVLAVATGSAAPPFRITALADLTDPRVKGRVAMSRPTAGATGAHLAAIYATWGPDKAAAFLRSLHDNGIALLGGNAEVANQVGSGVYSLGLTDSDAIVTAQANGGKLDLVAPDQNGDGALAMPTTVALVKGSRHEQLARKLIDYLLSRQTEQKLIAAKFARWSVRVPAAGDGSFKAMRVDYRTAAEMFPQAQREGTALLEGR